MAPVVRPFSETAIRLGTLSSWASTPTERTNFSRASRNGRQPGAFDRGWPDGGVFVGGAFGGTVDFDPGVGTTNLNSDGNFDAYVLQLDSDGNFVRVGRLGGPADDRALDVASDETGNVWAVGYFRNTTTGLATLSSIPAGADRDAFVLKLAPNGTGFTTTVAQQYGAEGVDEAHSVAIDPDGNVIIGGSFQFAVDFDQSVTGAFTLTSGGDDDAFVVKLDGDGNFLWARQMGGYRSDVLADLAVDPQGNIYTTGSFIDTVDFDPLDGTYYLSTAPQTNPQGFVQKLDEDGKFLWAAKWRTVDLERQSQRNRRRCSGASGHGWYILRRRGFRPDRWDFSPHGRRGHNRRLLVGTESEGGTALRSWASRRRVSTKGPHSRWPPA